MQSVVHANLPRGGLGNKLLVWARALVFAHTNHLPLFVSNWAEIKIGPYLRGEARKRQYWGYFNDPRQASWLRRASFLFFQNAYEPSLKRNPGPRHPTVYTFNRMPAWQDYFEDIREHRDLVRDSFYGIVAPKYVATARASEAPIIGVHIRRSDFQEENRDVQIGQACNVRTPLDYYKDVIQRIRAVQGAALPATIFTDGVEEEIADVLALPATRMADRNADIVDMMLLSQSRCLVVSAGSTFSYWAAFLGDCPVIKHPSHPAPIRPQTLARHIFEGPLTDQTVNDLLVSNLRAVSPTTRSSSGLLSEASA